MKNVTRLITTVIAAGAFLPAMVASDALAQGPKMPAAQETNVEDVSAEVVEAVRKEGVLTVKVRYRNTGAKPAKLVITKDFRDVDQYYVVAGNTKFLILKDAQKIPLMSALNNYGALAPEVKPAGSFLFWAKYPAPPAEAKKLNFHMPQTPPFEDVPITEAK